MAKDFYQVSLKIILKNEQGQILVLKGHPRGSFAGFYDLPGGRIEEDEFSIPLDLIIEREIKEEIGEVDVEIGLKPVAVGRHLIPAAMTEEKKDLHLLYVFFEAKLRSGQVSISNEHDGYKWLSLNDINLADFFKSGILEGIKMYLNS